MWIRNSLKWTLMILFVAAATGCSLLPKEEEGLKPPLVEPVKEQLALYEVKRGDISKQIKGTAVFEPEMIAYHQFSSNGKLKELHVQPGQQVQKGDLLVEKDVAGLELTIKQRELEVEKKKYALEKSKSSRDPQDMKIKSMELEIAQIRLDAIYETYNESILTAEIEGQVTYITDLEPGDQIKDREILVSISDTTQMRLSYQSSNLRSNNGIELGMDVDIEYNNQSYRGEVIQTPLTAPRVENQQLADKYASRLYIEMPELPDDAEFGAYADIEITLAEKKDTLIIPLRGLRTYLGRNYVQILEGESRKEMDVEKGLESATEVEILKGLEEGQQIILK